MDDVALAAMGGTPISVSMPKVRNVPPPATALIPPENSAAKNSKTISDNDKLGCPIFPGRHCCPGIGASPNARSKETICLAAVTDPSRYCRWLDRQRVVTGTRVEGGVALGGRGIHKKNTLEYKRTHKNKTK